MFDIFNYSGTIKKIDVVEGSTDQSTGEWIPETTTQTTINGHISDLTNAELATISAGTLEKGVRKLTCDTSEGIVAGDRIKIVESDGSEIEWQVRKVLHQNSLISKYTGEDRTSFLIVRQF